MATRRDVFAGAAALSMTHALPISAQTRPFVPAGDTRHERTFMQWPVSRRVYGNDGFLDDVQQTIADIANMVSAFEPVVMLAHREDHAAARRQLSEDVELWDVPTEDLWARDSGPLFSVAGDRLEIQSLNFNGWGQKPVHTRDGQIAAHIAEILDVDLLDTGLIGEAGGVEQDGHGLLIAHESSWVNDNRNPGMSRGEISRRLNAAFGADQVIWAPGLAGQDITDYHIDSLARFTAPGRVLVNLPRPLRRGDPFHMAALRTYDTLVAAGLQVDVIAEPTDARVQSDDFVASYANFYVCNGAVIAAQFGDSRADAMAEMALARHFPGREVILLNVDPLGEVGGGIHCATQQQPALL